MIKGVTPYGTLVLMEGCQLQRNERMPAIDLYNGPLWQTLRRRQGMIPSCNVCVLSGKHGFINACTVISPYDEPLTGQKVTNMIARPVTATNTRFSIAHRGAWGPSPILEAGGAIRIPNRPYDAVVLAASGNYETGLRHILGGFLVVGLVGRGVPIIIASGSLGERCQELAMTLHWINGQSEGDRDMDRSVKFSAQHWLNKQG